MSGLYEPESPGEPDTAFIYAATLADRSVIALGGAEARAFLQGLISNDIEALAPGKGLYAALLTPQGKILYEFFLGTQADEIWLDCASVHADALLKKLTLYKLRAKVEIAPRPDLTVTVLWTQKGEPVEAASVEDASALPDPRLPELGARIIGTPHGTAKIIAATDAAVVPALAYRNFARDRGIPESADMPPDTVFALDAGFEELSGVSFKKGCYVGQEVTARMKHRATARKRFVIAQTHGPVPAPGTPILSEGREVGIFAGGNGMKALALVRLDRWADTGETPLGQKLKLVKPGWLEI